MPSLRWMGLQTLSSSTGRWLYHLAVDCECILVWLLRTSLLYQRNILFTRNADSHTCILDLHVDRISSDYFYFSSISCTALHSYAAVSLPACGCDLGSILLLWSLLPFARLILSVFFQRLLLVSHISLVFDTSAQRQYGTCYVINFLRIHWHEPPGLLFRGCQTTSILALEVLPFS